MKKLICITALLAFCCYSLTGQTPTFGYEATITLVDPYTGGIPLPVHQHLTLIATFMPGAIRITSGDFTFDQYRHKHVCSLPNRVTAAEIEFHIGAMTDPPPFYINLMLNGNCLFLPDMYHSSNNGLNIDLSIAPNPSNPEFVIYTEPNITYILPDAFTTLKSRYSEMVTAWQYRIGNASWTTIANTSSLNVKGDGTISDFINIVKQGLSVEFRAQHCSAVTSASFYGQAPVFYSTVLEAKMSLPSILSHTTVAPSCPGKSDGKLRILLNRDLYDDEELSFAAPAEIGGGVQAGRTVAGPTRDRWITIDSLSVGPDTLILETGRIKKHNNDWSQSIAVLDSSRRTVVFTIPAPSTYTYTASVNDVLCFGQDNGGFEITVSGSSAPYTLFIDNSPSATFTDFGSYTLSGYEAGTYALGMENANGCPPDQTPQTFTAIITAPASATALSVTAVDHPKFFGDTNGSFSIAAFGGTGSYTFSCTGPAGFTSHTDAAVFDITDAKDGTYTVTVTDENNCTASAQVVLVEPPPLVLNAQLADTIRCNSQNTAKIQLSAVGGYLADTGSYTFSLGRGMAAATLTSNGIYEGLSAGTYNASVTDNNNISKYDTLIVLQPPPLSATLESADVRCFGGSSGSIAVNAAGGTAPYTSQFFKNGSPYTQNTTLSVVGLSSATYAVVLSDKYGCSYSPTQQVISEPATPVQLLTPTITQPTYFGADNGQITIPVIGCYGPYEDAAYKVYLYDSLGVATAATLTDIGGSSALTASNLTAGSYSARAETDFFESINYLAAADLRGCFDTLGFYVPQPPKLIPYTEQTDSIRCYGHQTAAVHLTAEGGYFAAALNYKFNLGKITSPSDTVWIYPSFHPESMYSELSAGTYVAAVIDENGIIASKAFTIAEPDALEVQHQLSHVHCFGGSDGKITLSPNGGTLPYSFSITPSSGSADSHTVNGSYTLSGLAADTYTVAFTDRYNCLAAAAAQHVITVPTSSVSLSLTQQSDPLAFGYTDGIIEAQINGGTPAVGGYAWTWINQTVGLPPDNIQSDGFYLKNTELGDGYYHLAVYDSHYTSVDTGLPSDLRGCFDTLSVQLTEPPLLKVNITLQDSIRCNGTASGVIHFNGEGGYLNSSDSYRYRVGRYNGPGNISWIQSYGTSDSFTHLAAGQYAVEVIDGNSITSQSLITVPEPEAFNVSLEAAPSLCGSNPGGALTAVASGATPPYRYAWYSSGDEECLAETPSLTNVNGGIYFLKITDKWDCLFTDYAVVPHIGMNVSSALTHPSCHNGDNGAVNLTVSGGQAPYQYQWNNGTAGSTDGVIALSNLTAGSYNLTLTDAQGCAETYTFTLLSPEGRTIDNIPEQITVCRNQCFEAVPDCLDAKQYFWYNNGILFSQESQVSICDAGSYLLRIVTDIQNNCAVEHHFNVTELLHEVPVEFAVASKVATYKEIKIVNISYPAPERQEWILPTDGTAFSVLSQSEELLSVEFYKTGVYAFGLIGQTGECVVTLTKDVEVVDEYDLPYEPDSQSPFIMQFVVYPNPVAAGQMNILIELREQADIMLLLYDMSGAQRWSKQLQGNSTYAFTESLSGLSAGWYLLLLNAGNETASRQLIFQ